MESTRPIRALMRGLDALTVLNLRDGATVSEVAHEIRLPRTTVYRILETLCSADSYSGTATDERYRLTILVRGLSGGFDDEAWVTQIAKPIIHNLCRRNRLARQHRHLVRHEDDAARNHRPQHPACHRALFGRLSQLPLLTTAMGRVYLANCAACAARRADRNAGALQQGRRQGRAQSRRSAAGARGNQGAGLRDYHAHAPPGQTKSAVSVPVPLNDGTLAGLRCASLPPQCPSSPDSNGFCQSCATCAAKISATFSAQQAEARAKGAPQATA